MFGAPKGFAAQAAALAAATTWRYQTADGLSVHAGSPTDARGLQLRSECGYSHVDTGNGWLELPVAIRKACLAERITALEVQP